MRQSQLKAFHSVALFGGFSRAAEAMSISQPAISEQVRKLEQAHDVLLFHRDKKNIHLTHEGEGLFLLTKRLFEVEDQIADYMSETRAVVEGELRIIVDSAHHITDMLSKFRRSYPKIHVVVRTGNSEDVLSALRSYDAEIGVVGAPAAGNDMQSLDLGSSSIVAFAAKGFLPGNRHEISLAELTELPLVFREKSSKTRQKLETEASIQGLKLRPAIQAEGREAVREIVASGAGIGFVSTAEFGHDNRIAKYDLKECELRMNEFMVFLSQRQDVRVIRVFMDFAKTHLSQS
jgi:aminoethylphosphonate catabolism LysR family transcriptional regulator